MTVHDQGQVTIEERWGGLWLTAPTRVDMSSKEHASLGLEQPDDQEALHQINLDVVQVYEVCGYHDPHDYEGPVVLMSYAIPGAGLPDCIKLAVSIESIRAALDAATEHRAVHA